MAQIDNLYQYESLSIDELYNLLFTAITNMVDASEKKNHQSILDSQNEVFFIKSLIEERRTEIAKNQHGLTSI